MQFIDHAAFVGGKSRSLDQAVDAGRADWAADTFGGQRTVLSMSDFAVPVAPDYGRDFWLAFINRDNPDVLTPAAGGHSQQTSSDHDASAAQAGTEGTMPCGWQGLDPTN